MSDEYTPHADDLVCLNCTLDICIDNWPSCAYQALPDKDRERQFKLLSQRAWTDSHRLRKAEGVAQKITRTGGASRTEYFQDRHWAKKLIAYAEEQMNDNTEIYTA